MDRRDLDGVERYIFMQTEMTLLALASGVPFRQAVATAIRATLDDQAYICARAGDVASSGASKSVRSWYNTQARDKIRYSFPGVGESGDIAVPFAQVQIVRGSSKTLDWS